MSAATDDDAAVERIADRLTAAIAANDADAMAGIYTPDARIWHSTDQIELSVEQLVETVRAIGRVATATVVVKARHATADGFVQTQVNDYAFHGGGGTSFHAALFARVAPDGRIGSIEEYLDGAALAPLLAALA
jgi:uncharacterized protein (TIGR02246 family)